MNIFYRQKRLHFLVQLWFLIFYLPCLPQALKAQTSSPLKAQPVASGFVQITDIQFLPKSNELALVLEKTGNAWFYNLTARQKSKVLSLNVATQSELGLLGAAFHPNFETSKKVYLHYNPRSDLSRVSEWVWSETKSSDQPVQLLNERIILEINQPYKNHNGGSLLFGPDGLLYIGMGDGGSGGDPKNLAQNLNSLLGKMLRINVDRKDPGREYAVPKDNPFVSSSKGRPEIFALGLRNPWKYTFDNRGRLIAGDVGQNKWEEITFVPKGANLGWRIYEASHCYDTPTICQKNLRAQQGPIAEYGHDLGASVTGGQQYGGQKLKGLAGRYFFGDFVTGRIWSIKLPELSSYKVQTAKDFMDHGKFEIAISTFAKDSNGELYVADFNSGSIFRLSQ